MKNFRSLFLALLALLGICNVWAQTSATYSYGGVTYSVVDYGYGSGAFLYATSLSVSSITDFPTSVTVNGGELDVNGIYFYKSADSEETPVANGIDQLTSVTISESITDKVGSFYMEAPASCTVTFKGWGDYFKYVKDSQSYFGDATVKAPQGKNDDNGLVWGTGDYSSYVMDYAGTASSVTIPSSATFVYMGAGFKNVTELYLAGNITCTNLKTDFVISKPVANAGKLSSVVFEYQSTLTNFTKHNVFSEGVTLSVKEYTTDDKMFSIKRTSTDGKDCAIASYLGSEYILKVPSQVVVGGNKIAVREIHSLGEHPCDVFALSFEDFEEKDNTEGYGMFWEALPDAFSGLSNLGYVEWGSVSMDGVTLPNEDIQSVVGTALYESVPNLKDGLLFSNVNDAEFQGFPCDASGAVTLPENVTTINLKYPNADVTSITLAGAYSSSNELNIENANSYVGPVIVTSDADTYAYLFDAYPFLEQAGSDFGASPLEDFL